jgi:hypothetical protein
LIKKNKSRSIELFEDEVQASSKAIVYVGTLEFPFCGMLMSHMGSPDVEELHKMADKIGVSRRHFQNHELHPHYDICKSKKALALKHGAEEVSDKVLILKCYPGLANFMRGGEIPKGLNV